MLPGMFTRGRLALLTLLCLAGAAAAPAYAQDWGEIRAILRGALTELGDDAASGRAAALAEDAAAGTETAVGETKAKRSDRPFVPSVFVRGGEVLRGSLPIAALNVRTPFGLLRVPAEELVEVTFFTRLTEERHRELAAVVERLSHDDYAAREAATEALRATLAEAVPLLEEAAASSPDPEVVFRAESLLEEAEARDDEANGALFAGHDRVVTRTLEIGGVVELDRLPIETPYGAVRVPRQEILRVVFREREQRSANLEIPATALAPAGYVSTGLRVETGERIRIEAEGQLQVPNYSYTCGPEGVARESRLLPGFRILTLIGRIGTHGAPFEVGRSYQARSPANGTLYLGIVPFRYASPSGSYRAEVEVSN